MKARNVKFKFILKKNSLFFVFLIITVINSITCIGQKKRCLPSLDLSNKQIGSSKINIEKSKGQPYLLNLKNGLLELSLLEITDSIIKKGSYFPNYINFTTIYINPTNWEVTDKKCVISSMGEHLPFGNTWDSIICYNQLREITKGEFFWNNLIHKDEPCVVSRDIHWASHSSGNHEFIINYFYIWFDYSKSKTRKVTTGLLTHTTTITNTYQNTDEIFNSPYIIVYDEYKERSSVWFGGEYIFDIINRDTVFINLKEYKSLDGSPNYFSYVASGIESLNKIKPYYLKEKELYFIAEPVFLCQKSESQNKKYLVTTTGSGIRVLNPLDKTYYERRLTLGETEIKDIAMDFENDLLYVLFVTQVNEVEILSYKLSEFINQALIK